MFVKKYFDIIFVDGYRVLITVLNYNRHSHILAMIWAHSESAVRLQF